MQKTKTERSGALRRGGIGRRKTEREKETDGGTERERDGWIGRKGDVMDAPVSTAKAAITVDSSTARRERIDNRVSMTYSKLKLVFVGEQTHSS